MKQSKIASLIMGLFISGAAGIASAEVLTFDNLGGQMDQWTDNTGTGIVSTNYNTLIYQEQGFALTLHAPNAVSSGAHIGDAGNLQTFNWHDGDYNGAGAYVTFTRVGGGLFDLLGFDYSSSGMEVTAAGFGSVALTGTGNYAPSSLFGISSITFTSSNVSYNALDNINVAVAPVPEPETFAMLLAGLGLLSFTARRKKQSA